MSEKVIAFNDLDWRVKATLSRIADNAAAIIVVLESDKYMNLAGQFKRDADNITYWLEQGGLTTAAPDAAEQRGEWGFPVTTDGKHELELHP